MALAAGASGGRGRRNGSEEDEEEAGLLRGGSALEKGGTDSDAVLERMYREGCARDDYDAVLERMYSEAGARGPWASLSWPQQVGILICCLANTVDAVEVMSLSYVLPRLKGKYPAWMQGSLSAAVFGGMLVGGLIGGAVCDRVGRRATMIVSMLLNASFSLAFAAASDASVMVGVRVLTGIGIGAAVPVRARHPACVSSGTGRNHGACARTHA